MTTPSPLVITNTNLFFALVRTSVVLSGLPRMPTDSRHGRRIPSGVRLARLLSVIFARTYREVRPVIEAGSVPDPWRLEANIFKAALPCLAIELAAGYRAVGRSVRGKRKGAKALRFDPGDPSPRTAPSLVPPANVPPVVVGIAEMPEIPGIRIDWNLFPPAVRLEAQRLALELAGDVAETTKQLVRSAIESGLNAGKPVAEIAKAVRGEAFSTKRAMAIAQTESSRAMHAGQGVAAREIGVTHWTWLASSDACDNCKELDGKMVKIGEPFYVWPTGNPAYRVVTHPPAHPHCYCTTTEEVPDD